MKTQNAKPQINGTTVLGSVLEYPKPLDLGLVRRFYKKENFILYKKEISNSPLLTIQSWNETLFQ